MDFIVVEINFSFQKKVLVKICEIKIWLFAYYSGLKLRKEVHYKSLNSKFSDFFSNGVVLKGACRVKKKIIKTLNNFSLKPLVPTSYHSKPYA